MEDKTVIGTPPPPPSEVKIRTMRSDIASMMQAGGIAAPAFRSVPVAGLSVEKEKYAGAPPAALTPMPTPGAIQRPATENVFPASPASPAPAERPVIGEEVSPRKDLLAKIIVAVVAIVALAAVGYVAYITLVK